ncbi:hypothetical protein D9757_010485 [Collybiopsis confluens]|uniref:Uncharacterized protein n=1 Tax=Collybiopsis confluens TaxID=2823264 RepID=A0A8H5FR55_9AGAR|nr:hypothetical protein D9757_014183 [Collybiopsis confluens]KAF5373517.1 hypothetical protein D9757_010485 [Collybiopsis confluens]
MKERPEPLCQYSRKTWGVFPPTSLTTHVHWWKHAGDAIVVVFGVSMTSTHQSMYLHHFYSQICGVLVVPSTGGVHVATTASGCAIGEWFCDNSKQIGSGYLAPLLSLRQMGDNSNVCPLAHTSVTIPRYLYDH